MNDSVKTTDVLVSRRTFLGAMGVGVAGLLLGKATPAFADELPSDPGITRALPEVDPLSYRIVTKEEIDQMWAEVLADAKASGAEIVLNQPGPVSSQAIPYSTISKTVQANITVGGVGDIVYLLAKYENSSSGTRITKVYDKYAYGFYSTCENGSYSHVIADGGRTLVINATVTLRNGVGFAQSFTLHGEFGPTKGNFLNVAYI